MMKKNRSVICVILFTLMISLCACSNDNNSASEEGDTSVSQPATIVEPDSVEQAVQQADAFTSVDKLVGSWTDIGSPDRFVNITQIETGYQYEDNEGKYPATFDNGKLTVKVSDTGNAEAYIDAKTGHLLSVYDNNISEYQRK